MMWLADGLCRAGFEPGYGDGIAKDIGSSSALLGHSIRKGANQSHDAAQNRRRFRFSRSDAIGAPSFSPYRATIRGVGQSPFRLLGSKH